MISYDFLIFSNSLHSILLQNSLTHNLLQLLLLHHNHIIDYFNTIFIIKLDFIEVVIQGNSPESNHEDKENCKKSNLEKIHRLRVNHSISYHICEGIEE